jgi:predicted site-specific integrase-resolvase
MRPAEVAQTLSVGWATIYRHLKSGTLSEAASATES